MTREDDLPVFEEPPTVNAKDIWQLDEVPESGTKIVDQMDRRIQPEYDTPVELVRYLESSLDMKCTTSNVSALRMSFYKWATRIPLPPAVKIWWSVDSFSCSLAELFGHRR